MREKEVGVITGGGTVGKYDSGMLNIPLMTCQNEYGCNRAVPLSSRVPRERTDPDSKSAQTNTDVKGKQETHIFIPKILLRYALNLIGINRINRILDLPGRHPLAAGHELPPDILRNGRRAIKAE